jgi:YtcA family
VIAGRSYRYIRGFALLPLLFSSCTRAPSFDILGSFFPAWLVCFAAAILITVVARLVLLRLGIAIVLPSLAYPCLTASFTFLMWLLFFR